MLPVLCLTEPDGGLCTARLDRVQFLAETRRNRLPQIPGFYVERDSFVRACSAPPTYRRVRNCANPRSQTTLGIQYQPAPPWLAPIKATVIGDDYRGLQLSELEKIFKAFKNARLLTVELAWDFSVASGVDRAFVMRHAVCGKSKLAGGPLYKDLRFGTRHSRTMVRAYPHADSLLL